ncbi:MAG: DNA primase [candidate division WOR-3 bacterium]
MIRQEVLDRIRDQTDIVELISGYVQLKRVGRNYRGLCPFHAERSPSFYVSQERQSYHCFGCGAGGTAVSFVMAQEKLEFPEAVRFLAARLGIEVEVERSPGRNRPLYDACERAAVFFEEQLGKSEPGQRYLDLRGLKQDTTRRFRLGFAPEGNALRGAARKRGWSEDALVGAGLLVRRPEGFVDYFHGRVMFPVFSQSGKIIGFSGRVLGDAEPKYLNSPDTSIFRKGEGLYGLFQAKSYIRDEVPVVVEGNFDLLSLVNSGFNNVVAPLGTALTSSQALLLRRHNSRVLLCFDGDAAGLRACSRAIEVLLKANVDPQVVVLPAGSDPDALVRSEGIQGFRARLDRRYDFVDFVMSSARVHTVADKRQVLGRLAELLRMMSDQVTQELYANKVAALFDIDKQRLLRAGENARPKQTPSSVPTEMEARLVAVVVQDAGFAQLAHEARLSEVLTDRRLRSIVLLAESCYERQGYGPGMLIDLTEESDTRKLIAALSFGHGTLPSPCEFRRRVSKLRAAWLMGRIEAAHSAGDEQMAEELGRERSRLLQDIARKGVPVNEE